jgi:dihydrolipoamide dehydrogenase
LQKFDLIVIGTGSGLDVANAAYQHELKVAVIEKNRMGGTCLNRGCIPSKLLIHSADVAETIKQADLFGLKVDGFSIDFQSIVERVNGIIDFQSEEIRKSFEGKDNPKLFAKECKFVGEKTISVHDAVSGDSNDNENNETITITADKILIASGTRPRIPKINGLKESGYITSDEALRLKKQPKVLTIIGGGYIACELAHFFGTLGTKINIIQRREVLIPQEDEDISKRFTEIFSKKYNVLLGYEAEFVTKKGCDDSNSSNNNSKIHVIAKNSYGEQIELDSDQLLIAAGRIPNSDTLDLEKTGVKINKRGFIMTDRYLETNIKGIFALGDAIGRYLFKHSANYEAEYAYYNILHQDNKIPISYHAMPHAIFSSPQVAGVGFTEQELVKEEGRQENNSSNNNSPKNIIEYQKSVYPYIETGMGRAIEDHDGFVKFLVSKKDRKILGCHIIGNQASILIHEVLVAMKADANGDGRGGTIDNITKTIHIHPALSEVVARAAAAAVSNL